MIQIREHLVIKDNIGSGQDHHIALCISIIERHLKRGPICERLIAATGKCRLAGVRPPGCSGTLNVCGVDRVRPIHRIVILEKASAREGELRCLRSIHVIEMIGIGGTRIGKPSH